TRTLARVQCRDGLECQAWDFVAGHFFKNLTIVLGCLFKKIFRFGKCCGGGLWIFVGLVFIKKFIDLLRAHAFIARASRLPSLRSSEESIVRSAAMGAAKGTCSQVHLPSAFAALVGSTDFCNRLTPSTQARHADRVDVAQVHRYAA